MKSHSEAWLGAKGNALIKQADAIVRLLPDTDADGSNLVRCHEVARIVGSLLHLEWQDGRYGRVDHSWLWVPDGRNHPFILDPYCVGRLPMVQMVDMDLILPHRKMYVAGPLRHDIWTSFVDTYVKELAYLVTP